MNLNDVTTVHAAVQLLESLGHRKDDPCAEQCKHHAAELRRLVMRRYWELMGGTESKTDKGEPTT